MTVQRMACIQGLLDATKAVFEEAYVNGADAEETLAKAEEKAAEVIAENE